MDDSSLSPEAKRQRLEVIYGRLSGWWNSLGEPKAEDRTINGTLLAYRSTLSEVEELTGKSNSFMPHCEEKRGQEICSTLELKTAIGGLAEELRSEYVKNQISVHLQKSTAASTAIYQNFSQSNVVSINLLTEITNIFKVKQEEFTDADSKERKFIDLIKQGLNTVKDTASLLSLLMAAANQVGMTLEQLKNFFH